MIDGKTTRPPRRIASERAKAFFLGDVTKQLEKEERELKKALKASRMEAQRAKKNENDSKCVKSRTISHKKSEKMVKYTTKSTETTTTTTTTIISPKDAKTVDESQTDCVKKFNWIIKTRSQGNKANQNKAEENKQSINQEVSKPNKSASRKLVIKPHSPVINGTKINSIVSSIIAPSATIKQNETSTNAFKANGLNYDTSKPHPRIMAQRKFASCTYNGTNYLKNRDADFSSSFKELFIKHKPSTEDFLTFLCFRSTDFLPPHLDFYTLNNINQEKLKDGDNMIADGTSEKNSAVDLTTIEKTRITSNDSNEASTKSNDVQSSQNCPSSTSNSTRGSKGLIKDKNVHKKVNSNDTDQVVKGTKKKKDEPKLPLKTKSSELKSTQRKITNRAVRRTPIMKNKMSPKLRNLQTGEAKTPTAQTNKVATRACLAAMKKSKKLDENEPKKLSSLASSLPSLSPSFQQPCPLRKQRSPKTQPTQQKSQTKVSILNRAKKINMISSSQENNVNHVSPKKITKTKVIQSKITNKEVGNKSLSPSSKIICDRILRSGRKASSNKSVNTKSLVTDKEARQQLAKNDGTPGSGSKNKNSPILRRIAKSQKSAISSSTTECSPKARKIPPKNCDTPPELTVKRSRTIPTLKSNSNSDEQKCKLKSASPLKNTSSSLKFTPNRVETRSFTKKQEKPRRKVKVDHQDALLIQMCV